MIKKVYTRIINNFFTKFRFFYNIIKIEGPRLHFFLGYMSYINNDKDSEGRGDRDLPDDTLVMRSFM